MTAPGAALPERCTHTSSGRFPTAGVALFTKHGESNFETPHLG